MNISKAAGKRIAAAIFEAGGEWAGRLQYRDLIKIINAEDFRPSMIGELAQWLAQNDYKWQAQSITTACATEAVRCNEILRGLNSALTDLNCHFEANHVSD